MRCSVRLGWFWLEEPCDGGWEGSREPERERFRLGETPLAVSLPAGGDFARPEGDACAVLAFTSTPDAAMTAFAFSFVSRIMPLPSAAWPELDGRAESCDSAASSPAAPFGASGAVGVDSCCDGSCDWSGSAAVDATGDGMVYVRVAGASEERRSRGRPRRNEGLAGQGGDMNDLLMSAIGPSKRRVGAGWEVRALAADVPRQATGVTHSDAIAPAGGSSSVQETGRRGGRSEATYQSCTQ